MSNSGTSSQTHTFPACLRSTSTSCNRIGSPRALATSAIRVAWARSTSGYTTGSQQRSPLARFVFGVSSRTGKSTLIDLLISITLTYVDLIRSTAMTTDDAPPLARRLLAELLGSAFLAALVIGSGIAAQAPSPGRGGLAAFQK